jgi:hypothetical protein
VTSQLGTGISKSFFYGEASPLVFAIQPISKTLTMLFYIHRVHEILLDHVTIQNKRGTKILDFHSVSTVISSYALLVGRKRTPTIWDL